MNVFLNLLVPALAIKFSKPMPEACQVVFGESRYGNLDFVKSSHEVSLGGYQRKVNGGRPQVNTWPNGHASGTSRTVYVIATAVGFSAGVQCAVF